MRSTKSPYLFFALFVAAIAALVFFAFGNVSSQAASPMTTATTSTTVTGTTTTTVAAPAGVDPVIYNRCVTAFAKTLTIHAATTDDIDVIATNDPALETQCENALSKLSDADGDKFFTDSEAQMPPDVLAKMNQANDLGAKAAKGFAAIGDEINNGFPDSGQ